MMSGFDCGLCGAHHGMDPVCETLPDVLTPEEQAWEFSGRSRDQNPIINAIIEHVIHVQTGESDPEDGLETERDVIERWVWYLAEGEQDVSWYRPVLVQADAYLRVEARFFNLEHRPAILEPVA